MFFKKNILHTLACLTILCSLFLTACGGYYEIPEEEGETDPADVTIGERLFLETRFAQSFFREIGDDINASLESGDPVMDITETLDAPLTGPFKGQSMNCAACHLVDQHVNRSAGGMRTYSDFARRSPIPTRDDERETAPRNSPPLVNANLVRETDFFLHFDGQFSSPEELVVGTLTGRNFGWLVGERDDAIAHIARIIREDDGSDRLSASFGGFSYATLFSGTSTQLPRSLTLPVDARLDVSTASDEEIVEHIALLITAYLDNLVFVTDDTGAFSGSPYDLFLRKNNLPTQPGLRESNLDYTRRLREAVSSLTNPRYVRSSEGDFRFHDQRFVFGETELQGLETFLAEPESLPLSTQALAQGGIGNCIACHAAPTFTDFRFHNTGTAQAEYDAIHGDGTFLALAIPSLAERDQDPESFLPASLLYPNGSGIFLDVPAEDKIGHTDLGMWNVFANDAHPLSQVGLTEILCNAEENDTGLCDEASLLPLAIARFKTPGLRDLGHSAPYMHTGQFDDLESVLTHYKTFSERSRDGLVRNTSLEFNGMALVEDDLPALAAFLRSLNEDYE